MARTPLFARLMARLRLARAAAAAGVAPDELLARTRAARAEAARARAGSGAPRGLSRRELLQATGAAAGALALSPLLHACGDGGGGGEPRIAIVGGGMAGLLAAQRLGMAGVSATIYEASDRLGGRMFTDRATFGPEQHCELGGELIDTGHLTMLDLASELSIELLDYDSDPLSAVLTAHFGGALLSEQDILTGFMPIAAEIDAALATLTDQEDLYVYYDKPNGGEALDALSLTAWLDSIAATGPVRDLLEVAYNIEYGLEADETNCLNMLFLISTETTSFEVFGDSDERFHAKNGNDEFMSKLAAQLPAGTAELGHALMAVGRAGSAWTLTFDTAAGAREVTADHVIFALPFTRLRQVDLAAIAAELRPEKQLAIDTLGYGTNNKLMVGFDGKPWRDAGSGGEIFTDLGFQSAWETSRLQAGTQGILTFYTGGDPGVAAGQGTPAERAAEAAGQLATIFPGADMATNGNVARFHWPTHPQTLGSYSAYKVGQYTMITGVESLAEGGGSLHFAGEHTSLDAQGYMEGAALSGIAAADEVLAALGLDAGALFTRRLVAAGVPRARAAEHPWLRTLARARAARAHRRWKAAPGRAARQRKA